MTNVFGDEFKLNSDPKEANITVRDFSGSINHKLGKTPYLGSIQDLATTYAQANFFLIVVEKEGYIPQSIVMTDLLKSDATINVNLEPIQDLMRYRALDKSMADLFEAQRLIRANQYDEALELLKKIEEKEKNLSIVAEIIGSTYYLKKDLKAALVYYKKAYRLNPENKDAYTMKAYIEKSLGIDDGKAK
jgi:tetratricopeptide (TPR) repeat protein